MAILVTVGLGMAMAAIPSRMSSLGGGALALGGIGAIRSMAYLILCQFAGRLSDRIGRKITISVAMIFMMVSFGIIPFLPSPRSMLLVSPLLEVGSALFWAPLVAWIGDSYRGGSLRSATSLFNVAWSLGVAGGAFIGGSLYDIHPALPFILHAGMALATLIICLCTKTSGRAADAEEDPNNGLSTRLSFLERYPPRLLGTWMGNFAIGISSALAIYIFRKVGSDLGQSAAFHGTLLFAYGVPRTLIFLIACKYNRWIGKVHHMLWAQVLGVLGLLLLYQGSAKSLFILAFALMGFNAGISFSISLYACISSGGERGKRSGIHEAMFGGGFFFGSLLGGILAQYFGLRTPFLVFALLNAALIFVQACLFRSRRPLGESRP